MKNYNWLRWIGVLPCAIASYFIIYGITKVLGHLSLLLSSDPDDYNWITKTTLPAFASGLGTYAYIKVGDYIAPKYKFATAIVLTIPMIILLSFTLYLQAAFRFRWDSLFEEVAGLVGLAYAFFEKNDGIYFQHKQELQHNIIIHKSDVESITLTERQIEAFRALYKAPEMPVEVIMAKLQGAKQHRESLKDDLEE